MSANNNHCYNYIAIALKPKRGEEEILSPVSSLLIIYYIYGLSLNDVSEYLYKIKCKCKKE